LPSTALLQKSIMFLSPTFSIGGAERQLVELALGLQRSGWAVTVVSCYDRGELRADLELAGVPVLCVHKRGRWDVAGFLWRLWKTIAAVRPQIVHGYALMPNLALALLRPFIPQTAVIWGVRNSWAREQDSDFVFRAQTRLTAILSRRADLIICNSETGRADYVAYGYVPHRMIVVPNGVDTGRFRPDAAARRAMRDEWGIAHDHVLIGKVARLHPAKDHGTFLRAAGRIARLRPDAQFVCVGEGPPEYLEHLERIADECGLRGRLIWAGARHDMPRVYNALDVAVSSSTGAEGVPNAIGEAMATGLRCVATDVGDSAAWIGELGTVCPPADGESLARAITSVLAVAPGDARIRQRICEHYSSAALLERTVVHLLRALRPPRAAPAGARGRRVSILSRRRRNLPVPRATEGVPGSQA
jgi:glycosyltransferase involved in cell wall biosynthesis